MQEREPKPEETTQEFVAISRRGHESITPALVQPNPLEEFRDSMQGIAEMLQPKTLESDIGYKMTSEEVAEYHDLMSLGHVKTAARLKRGDYSKPNERT